MANGTIKMADVYLLDGAVETAVNTCDEDLFTALMTGKEHIGKIDRFDTAKLSIDSAACIEFAPDEQRESENLTQTLLRRILPKFSHYPAVDAIIWSGVKGNAEFVEQGAWSAEPPCSYPHLPRHYSRWIRDRLGFENSTLMETQAACASSTLAAALAAGRIASGRCKSVLVVAADIVTRFTMTGFNALFALTAGRCRPFDVHRDGLMLGDGAAALLLAGEDYIKDSGKTPLAKITGWGTGNDAVHITAPSRDGRGLIAAITAAVEKAEISPEDIGAYCAHGTGTVYNDAMELTAVEKIFGDRPFPVFAVKGTLGHTLGATGGIEIMICARALEEGVVPPTAALQEADPTACGRVTAGKQDFDNKRILTTNSGFGGVNVALILENVKKG